MNNTIKYDIDFFTCPLSKKIFLEPMLASDGYFYENDFILSWLRTNYNSPITLQPINNILISATKLKCIINHFLELNPIYIKQQYTKDYSYINNRLFIMTYVKSNSFHKLSQYKDILVTDKLYDNIPLIKILSQYCTDYNIMIYIIDNCIDLDVYDDDGFRPIQYICMYSPDNIIQYAINKMEINFEIYNGSCPLLSYLDGISYNNKQLLHNLIDKTDDINQLSITGKNILDYLMYNNIDLDTLKLLHNKGFIVDKTSYALQYISSKNIEYFNFFTEIGWLLTTPELSKVYNTQNKTVSLDKTVSLNKTVSLDETDEPDETDNIQHQIISDFYNLLQEDQGNGNDNNELIFKILSNISNISKKKLKYQKN